MKKITLLMLFVLAIATSCQKEIVGDNGNTELREPICVPISLSVDDMCAGTEEAASDSNTYPIAKSKFEGNPLLDIQNLWVAQFGSNGKIVGSPHYISDYQKAAAENEGWVEVTLIPSGNEVNTLVYVANSFNDALTRELGSVFTIDEFKKITYPITSEASNFIIDENDQAKQPYFVLFGEQKQVINSSTTFAECTLIRNVAKINVKVKVTSGVGLTFVGAAMRGVPDVASYCPDYYRTDDDSDRVPDSDPDPTNLRRIPEYGSFGYITYPNEDGMIDSDSDGEYDVVSFYVPVNIRGVRESDSDEMKNHCATTDCTSISLLATTSNESGESYIYTFYLGENLTNDFNIKPNTEYTYTLTFNTIGDPETDLRIEDAGGVDYSLPNLSRSNCYILNPSAVVDSKYIIPIDRIDKFWGDSRYNSGNVKGNTLSDVGADGWEPVILWYDYNGIQSYDETTDQIGGFKIVKGTKDKTVEVTLPTDFFASSEHFNVVFAVRKKSDHTILWSWHLWITDYDPYPNNVSISTGVYSYKVNGGELHRFNNQYFNTGVYGGKLVLDRLIGARSNDQNGYGWNQMTYFAKSINSNIVKYEKPGILYYQFGRKDPLPVKGDTYVHYVNGYTPTGTVNGLPADIADISDVSGGSFAHSVNNPTCFVKNKNASTTGLEYNWCNEADSENKDFVWNDYKIAISAYEKGKSIFDPSPWGFRVPIRGVYTGFLSSHVANEQMYPDKFTLKLINFTYDENGDMMDYFKDDKTYEYTFPIDRKYMDVAYFPPCGKREPASGSVSALGTSCYLWMADSPEHDRGYMFYTSTTGGSNEFNAEKARGLGVLSVQE